MAVSTESTSKLRLLAGSIRYRRLLAGLAVLLAMAALLPALKQAPAQTAPIIDVVNGEVDVTANGKCSLIEAIENANDTVTGTKHSDCKSGNPTGLDSIAFLNIGVVRVD